MSNSGRAQVAEVIMQPCFCAACRIPIPYSPLPFCLTLVARCAKGMSCVACAPKSLRLPNRGGFINRVGFIQLVQKWFGPLPHIAEYIEQAPSVFLLLPNFMQLLVRIPQKPSDLR